jgi:hypothetical protein
MLISRATRLRVLPNLGASACRGIRQRIRWSFHDLSIGVACASRIARRESSFNRRNFINFQPRKCSYEIIKKPFGTAPLSGPYQHSRPTHVPVLSSQLVAESNNSDKRGLVSDRLRGDIDGIVLLSSCLASG